MSSCPPPLSDILKKMSFSMQIISFAFSSNFTQEFYRQENQLISLHNTSSTILTLSGSNLWLNRSLMAGKDQCPNSDNHALRINSYLLSCMLCSLCQECGILSYSILNLFLGLFIVPQGSKKVIN